MKKSILLLLLTISSAALFAQNRNQHVPSSVERSFRKDYSDNDNNRQWDYRNNQWHTRYTDRDHGNREVDIYYDRNGKRLYSQSSWDHNDVPVLVKNRIRTHYRYPENNYEVFRIERPGKGFLFQVMLKGNNKKKFYLDERGREVQYHPY